MSLKRLFLAAVNYVGTDLAATLENANHHRFVVAASSGDLLLTMCLCMLRALPPMNVSSTST